MALELRVEIEPWLADHAPRHQALLCARAALRVLPSLRVVARGALAIEDEVFLPTFAP